MKVANPYLEEASKYFDVNDLRCWWEKPIGDCQMQSFTSRFEARHLLVKAYSFSIPNQALIDALVEWSPILEVMAGTGYMASLVSASGGDIIATDVEPCNKQYFKRSKPWYPIERIDGISAVKKHLERSLLMSWPWMDQDCVKILQAFTGDRFIYVGETAGGCTGVDQFFELLEQEWNEVKEVRLPQWEGIHDHAVFYERKTLKTRGINLDD